MRKLLPLLVALSLPAGPARAADAPPSAPGPWPRVYRDGEVELSLYQPEAERWEGTDLHLRAAVAVKEGERTRYGILEIEARTELDEAAKVVHLHEVQVAKATFPGAGPDGRRYRALFEARLPGEYDLDLDRLRDQLAVSQAIRSQPKAARNDPPDLVFRTSPTLLVVVDGPPQWRPVEGTALERVVNTRPILLRDPAEKRVFLHVLDGWLEAPALGGPWRLATALPAALPAALAGAIQLGADPLEAREAAKPAEAGAQAVSMAKPPSLASAPPDVLVATRPTELVVSDGEPELEPIPGTGLLTWKNTTSDVFVETASGRTYVLAAGRWFRAGSTAGPFAYVDPKDLPADFRRIPPGHAREAVLASVAGTPQAREAVVENQVPQTATVSREATTFQPTYDGEPRLEPIEGTPLFYVPNSPVPIIEVAPDQWYAVRDGVWFVAPSASGPWSVATWVPPVIYSIPPSSPLHYVTYVRVYGATPSDVYVGYTPGYTGTYVDSGVVVYGTGYVYRPWIGAYWYGPPVTYGYGMRVGWSSWTGWCVSASWGWRPYGFWWGFGVAPYWGPAVVYRPVYYPVRPPPYYGYRPMVPAPVAAGGVYGRWGAAAVRPVPLPARPLAPLTAVRPTPARLSAGPGRYGAAPARLAPGAGPRTTAPAQGGGRGAGPAPGAQRGVQHGPRPGGGQRGGHGQREHERR